MHGPIIGPETLSVSYLRPLLMLMVTLGVATATPAQDLRMLGDNPADEGHVDASLIAQHDTWQPGTTVTVGLRLAMDEGWHTYWKNPGDAGMPTSITWDLPDGWTAHGIDWPTPVYFETNGIGGYGYVGTVVLPVRIDVPPDAAPGSVTLKAKASWLECADICIAGSADLQLTGRVGNDKPQPVAEHAELLAAAAARQPEPLPTGAATAFVEDNLIVLVLHLNGTMLEDDAAARTRFYPDQSGVIDMSASQEVDPVTIEMTRTLLPDDGGTIVGTGVSVSVPMSSLRSSPLDRLTGVLIIEPLPDAESPDPPRVWRIDVPVETLPSSEP